jgi:general secretion pathway protein A
MYQSYFGLAEAPFSIAPDPRYLFLSQRHQEALAHLLYGVNGGGGFVLLTGEVGAGKTTVCRCLLEQIPESCDVAYIFNPKQTVAELLSSICTEYNIATPEGNTSPKVFIDCINAYLLDAHARGRHTVLIIDEAQNLSADVLEQMRLLTNLETSQRKLLQIILLGQSELATMLAKPELRQLAQRIIARYHLGPLARNEVGDYVRHRLGIAGTQRQLFPDALIGQLYRLSGGLPRLINVLCDRALLGAYVQAKERVDRATLKQAAREVFYNPAAPQNKARLPVLVGLLAAFIAATVLYHFIANTPAPIPRKVETQPSSGRQQAIIPEKKVTLDTLEWPAAEPRLNSKVLAYTALFRAWGVDYQGKEECLQAKVIGLQCRVARGGLEELRQYNRPAVLLMKDNKDQESYATLTRLDDHSANLILGMESRTVNLAMLAEQWSGQYTLLFRKPPVKRQKIQLGDSGPDVEWVRSQLAQLYGKVALTNPEPVFDEVMMRQVKDFQLVHGLPPVGTVGAQTMLRMGSEADSSAPKLIQQRAGK